MTADEIRKWLDSDPVEAARVIGIGLALVATRPYVLDPPSCVLVEPREQDGVLIFESTDSLGPVKETERES